MGGQLGTAKKVLTLLDGGSAVVVNDFDTSTQMSFSTPWNDPTNDPVGIAITGQGTGIAVIRASTTGELRYALRTGAWSPGFGAQLATMKVGLMIQGGPSVAAGSSKGHVLYRGLNGTFYYASVETGLWNPTEEPVDAGSGASAGPAPPAIVVLNETPIAVFVGNDGELYDQMRSGGAWQAASGHGVAGQAAGVTPAVTALVMPGPELVVVYSAAGSSALKYTLRNGGSWTAPAAIAGASSADRVALAALPGGGAVLAYRSLDAHLHIARLSAGASPSWSAPVAGAGGADPTIVTTPAVATGAVGAEAELVFVGATDFIAYSSRLVAGAWTPPVLAGASDGYAALATGF
jgi:hypothetical protein